MNSLLHKDGSVLNPEPQPRDVVPRVMLWALALASTAIIGLASALFAGHSKSDATYREHNDGRVQAVEKAVIEIKTSLAIKNETDSRNALLLRAIARKMKVEVSEVEDGVR